MVITLAAHAHAGCASLVMAGPAQAIRAMSDPKARASICSVGVTTKDPPIAEKAPSLEFALEGLQFGLSALDEGVYTAEFIGEPGVAQIVETGEMAFSMSACSISAHLRIDSIDG